MELSWNEKKNKLLQKNRSISFEQIKVAIEQGSLLRVFQHPDSKYRGNQIFLLVQIEGYVYVVPAVPDVNGYFLKTIYPSRKYTKLYLKKENT